MPFATPKPSGEWQAATSPQPSRIFGAGPAIAGENTRLPSTPVVAATPTAPAALRTLRREMAASFWIFVITDSVSLPRSCSAPSRGLARRRRSRGALGGVERLREIADDVLGMFEADRKAHVAGRHAGCELLFAVELLMRRR